MHRAVGKTEQHRLFVGFEAVREPRRADEHVPGSKGQYLASDTAAAFTFDALNPLGRSCMKVPMVGIAQSPVTGFVYCSL